MGSSVSVVLEVQVATREGSTGTGSGLHHVSTLVGWRQAEGRSCLTADTSHTPALFCTYVGHCTLLSGSSYSIVASLFVSSKGLLTLFLPVCYFVENQSTSVVTIAIL